MPPFRNLLGRKPQPNGLESDGFDEARLSRTTARVPLLCAAVVMANRLPSTNCVVRLDGI